MSRNPRTEHRRQSLNGCVTCPKRWSDHTLAEVMALARPEQDEAVRRAAVAAITERWGTAIMESGGDQALVAFMDDLSALATSPPAAPPALDGDELIEIIEQAIFETGTGLEAAMLASERILSRLSPGESNG